MFKRITPVCIAAAVLLLANGCCCMQPQMCGDIACDSCEGGCGSSGCAVGCGPGRLLGGCLTNALTCGSGCGEVYWGEWTSDPPACCDPCDDYGNWTGEAYCAPRRRPFAGLRHLWGYRFAAAGCDEACASYPDTTTEFLPLEDETQEQVIPPKPDAEPIPAKAASAGRRVRHATYNRPVKR